MRFERSRLESVIITVGGVGYPARLPFKALAELEELSRESFMILFDRFATGNFNIADILNIVYVALKNGGVELTLEDLNDIDFTSDDLRILMANITELLNRAQKVNSQLQGSEKAGTDKKK